MWLILVLIVAAAVEAGAAAVYWLVLAPRAPFLVWNPDVESARNAWEAGAVQIDAELGWPPPSSAFVSPRDRTGAKENPDFPVSAHPCASAYGDSFVWDADVPLKDGWPEQLGRKLGCKVANYGVSAYGTDQAYLRFRRMAADDAPVVMLGIFPENVLRNVNQYRAFLGFSLHPTMLKGRFVIDRTGSLEWLPRPSIGPERLDALLSKPAGVIPQEYFLPDSADGPVTLRFPISLMLARVALMPRLRTRVTGRPSWAEFYATGHPSGAFELTVAIAQAFAHDAAQRGKRPLILMLPGASSFRARAKFGAFEYSPLVAALAARNVDVFDPGPAMLAELGERSYCTLYARPDTCEGHFGVSGSAVVADVVAAELARRHLIKQ